MLSRRVAAVRPLARALAPAAVRPRPQFTQMRAATTRTDLLDITDPNMNGGYINPPRINRQKRDPYGQWDDKQDRRNFNEPVHEDHDVLGVFSLHDYDHFTPGWAGVLLGTFIGSVLTLCAVTSLYYPDKISVPKTYEGGLDRELGGSSVVRAPKHGEEPSWK